MGWLGDGSHRGQGRQARMVVGLPPRYPAMHTRDNRTSNWQDSSTDHQQALTLISDSTVSIPSWHPFTTASLHPLTTASESTWALAGPASSVTVSTVFSFLASSTFTSSSSGFLWSTNIYRHVGCYRTRPHSLPQCQPAKQLTMTTNFFFLMVAASILHASNSHCKENKRVLYCR